MEIDIFWWTTLVYVIGWVLVLVIAVFGGRLLNTGTAIILMIFAPIFLIWFIWNFIGRVISNILERN